MVKKFSIWLEELEARKFGVRESILKIIQDGFKRHMNIDLEDDEILGMDLKNVPRETRRKLSSEWGPVKNNPDLGRQILKGEISVQEMIDILVGSDQDVQPNTLEIQPTTI